MLRIEKLCLMKKDCQKLVGKTHNEGVRIETHSATKVKKISVFLLKVKNWFFRVWGGLKIRQRSGFSERDARSEHLFDQGRSRDQVLELEVEDPLQTLNTERPEGRKSIQNSWEILLTLFLGLRVVGDVVLEGTDNSTLKSFHLLWFF